MARAETENVRSRPAGSFWKALGPGLITGASDDDPSGIATYSQTGARFAYTASWTLLYSYPLMCAVQIVAARLGRTTGLGLAGILRKHYSRSLLLSCVALLLVANIINIAADLGAMGDAVRLLAGGPSFLYVLLFGAATALLQVFTAYKQYAAVLKWLTLVLLAYVGTLAVAHVEWGAFIRNVALPRFEWSADYITAVVAVFGTTISPYLFFWQASQEVEEMESKPGRQPLAKAHEQAPRAERRIRLDTLIGMAVSNLVGLAIMTTAAATLHRAGQTNIESSAQAASALKPIAGAFAEWLFAIGIIGTGLLAVPVLGGAAAYALGEAFGWTTGLDRKPREAKAFYAALVLATVLGIGLNASPINPIQALFWSAVINGVVAVPIMALMMLLARNDKIMKGHAIGQPLAILGWIATGVMALAVVGMIGASLAGGN